MLKQKRMPRFVKVAGLFWAVIMMVSCMSTVASANTSQNTINQSWGSTVSSSWTTPSAQKDTSSSCYVSNSSSSSTDFKRIYVYGANVGSTWANCTSGTPRICYKGGTAPLPNYVNERHDNYAALTIGYDANPYVVLKGYWKADI